MRTMEEAFAKWWKTEPFTDEIRNIVKRGWDAGCAWTNLAIIERNPGFLAEGPVSPKGEPEPMSADLRATRFASENPAPGAVQGGPLEAAIENVLQEWNRYRGDATTLGYLTRAIEGLREARLTNFAAALRSSPPGPARPMKLQAQAAHARKWSDVIIVGPKGANIVEAGYLSEAEAEEIAYRINSFEPPKVEGGGHVQ